MKKVAYYQIKRNKMREVLRDLRKKDYEPSERGHYPFDNLWKFVEYGRNELEIDLVLKEIGNIIGDRGEVLLITD
jgi:hypothetical protein